MKLRLLLIVVLLTTISSAIPFARAQDKKQLGGALNYSIPKLTSLPPIRPDMPTDVANAYFLVDSVLRISSDGATKQFFERLRLGDTAKYLAKLTYLIDDYDPLLFSLYQWEAFNGDPYLCGPEFAFMRMKENSNRLYRDTERTYALIASSIIADVRVTDTVMKIDPYAKVAKRTAGVTCQILDMIKGQKVPACLPGGTSAKHGNGGSQTIATTPISTVGVTAAPGGCLQFEYWADGFAWVEDQITGDKWLLRLTDSAGQSWIRPDSEYVIFLELIPLTEDHTNDYFGVVPVAFGSCCCMYPVRNGHVYDPGDDFGFGTGLTVEDWKTKLRSRISTIVHPHYGSSIGEPYK